jgi:hypothetical protein
MDVQSGFGDGAGGAGGGGGTPPDVRDHTALSAQWMVVQSLESTPVSVWPVLNVTDSRLPFAATVALTQLRPGVGGGTRTKK